MSYLDKLKAKVSDIAHPTLLTKPTQAPSVSFVSSGWDRLRLEIQSSGDLGELNAICFRKLGKGFQT